MGPAPTYDFTLLQGIPLSLPLTYRNPNNADGSLGTPINITGYSAHMQVRPNHGSSEVLLDLTDTNGGIVLGGSAGTVMPTLTVAQTAALNFNTAVYDIKLYPSANLTGNPIRFLQGTITLSEQVTV